MANSFVRQQEVQRGAPLLGIQPRSESVISVIPDGLSDNDRRAVLRMSDSDIFFRVANPILQKGMDIGNTMTEDDIDECLPADIARNAHKELSEAWAARCQSGKPSLKKCVSDCWTGLMLCGSAFHFLEIMNGFISPLMIKSIVTYIETENKNMVAGLIYATLFFASPFLQTLFSSHFILRTRRVGIRLYAASTCMIFDKTLRLSQTSASNYGAGAIVNIAQVDTQRFDQTIFWVNFLWSMPLQLFIAVGLLSFYLGIAALGPVFIMALLTPVNNKLVKKLMMISRQTNKLRDARVKVLTEVMHATRLVKMLGWESQVSDIVCNKRLAEMANIASLMLWQVGNLLMWQAMPTLLPLVAFGPFLWLGGDMDPGTVFASLALLDSIRTPMTLFPQALQFLAQVQVGVERIEKLLLAEEVTEEELASEAMQQMKRDAHPRTFFRGTDDSAQGMLDSGLAIAAYNADFRWSKHSADKDDDESSTSIRRRARECFQRFRHRNRNSPAILTDVEEGPTMSFAEVVPPSLRVASLEIPEGKLVIVVGAVGAGKSTLLAGLLNEVPLESGCVAVTGSAAYCNQVPWIMQGTIQENILMGEPYDAERFANVIDKCALSTDLVELKDGKNTLIGERGVNLSGGQKARIQLARACYKDAALYFLDDPLSAVDMHVAKHLMDQCLGSSKGLLKKKTRILATHQVQYMQKADLVIVVQNGSIAAARPPGEFTRADLESFGLGSVLAEGEQKLKRQISGEATVEEPKKTTTTNTATEAQGAPRGEEEEREIGALSLSVWMAYAHAMGCNLALIIAIMYISKNGADVLSSFWLSHWSAKADMPVSEDVRDFSIYALLCWIGVFFLGGRVLLFRYVSLKVSRLCHDQALWAVLRSPMAFLDTTPTGRIVNRFSSDLQRVDMELRYSAAGFLDQIVSMLFAIAVSATYVPFLLFLCPLVVLYNRVQKRFRTTARELQRLFSRSKSPIFNGLDEAIIGVSSIRAYQKQAHFISRNREKVEANVRIMINLMCCNRWLAIRLRAIGIIPVAVVTFTLVLQEYLALPFISIPGATAALVLRFSVQLTTGMEGILQSLTSVELCLVALERMKMYGKLTPEPALVEDNDDRLSGWPSQGNIEFEGVVMRYRPELPTVLNGISFKIPGGTSVGVIGRTGAGKSSLLQALFRICPLDAGIIRIDGEDISRIGLHTLRQRLSIIPQDPIGFTGSIRFNLDPFFEHSDTELQTELEKVQLADFVNSKQEGLAYHLSAGGENLSVGQRQLLCAARAFLRKSSILVLDEATAAVDFQTDELIQQALRHAVVTRKLTTLTIAHRINTILGADNVLVMDRGVVGEFGPTQELAKDTSSRFYTFLHPNSNK